MQAEFARPPPFAGRCAKQVEALQISSQSADERHGIVQQRTHQIRGEVAPSATTLRPARLPAARSWAATVRTKSKASSCLKRNGNPWRCSNGRSRFRSGSSGQANGPIAFRAGEGTDRRGRGGRGGNCLMCRRRSNELSESSVHLFAELFNHRPNDLKNVAS